MGKGDPTRAGDPNPSDEDELDPDLLGELEALFRSESAARLAELHDALAAGEPRRVEHAAHRLAGDAAALGKSDVESTARDILQAAREAQLDRVPPLLEELTRRLKSA